MRSGSRCGARTCATCASAASRGETTSCASRPRRERGHVCCRRSPTAASAARARRRPGPCGERSLAKRTAGSSCPSTTTRTGPPRALPRGGRRRLGASCGAARDGRGHGGGRQRRRRIGGVARRAFCHPNSPRPRPPADGAGVEMRQSIDAEGRGPLRGELPRGVRARRARGGPWRCPRRDY